MPAWEEPTAQALQEDSTATPFSSLKLGSGFGGCTPVQAAQVDTEAPAGAIPVSATATRAAAMKTPARRMIFTEIIVFISHTPARNARPRAAGPWPYRVWSGALSGNARCHIVKTREPLDADASVVKMAMGV